MSSASDPAKPPTWREWKAQNGSKRWYLRYPLAVEWAFEWINHGLHRWAFVEFLEYAGKFTVLVVAFFWLYECDDRAKERHYRAWQLIDAARGSNGDGGRRDALQDLNKDGVSLAAAPLEKAHLPGVDLQGADVGGADLQGANLVGANLRGADLVGANLRYADLQGANLVGANLESAYLGRAVLVGANLRGANLRYANLLFAGADFEDARYLAQEQLNMANGDERTVLPLDLTRPAHWKAEGSEGQPAAQPDDAGRAPAAGGAPRSGK